MRGQCMQEQCNMVTRPSSTGKDSNDGGSDWQQPLNTTEQQQAVPREAARNSDGHKSTSLRELTLLSQQAGQDGVGWLVAATVDQAVAAGDSAFSRSLKFAAFGGEGRRRLGVQQESHKCGTLRRWTTRRSAGVSNTRHFAALGVVGEWRHCRVRRQEAGQGQAGKRSTRQGVTRRSAGVSRR